MDTENPSEEKRPEPGVGAMSQDETSERRAIEAQAKIDLENIHSDTDAIAFIEKYFTSVLRQNYLELYDSDRREWGSKILRDAGDNPDEERLELERQVEDRMYELRETQTFLAKRAEKFTRYFTLVKISVIILGALVATKETISVVVGTSNTISIVGYTLVGLLIAVLTGLEASFGWGTKSGKLAALAATCRATRQRAELDRAHIFSKENAEAKLALETSLDKLITQLQEVRDETIGFGLNPVRSVGSRVARPRPT